MTFASQIAWEFRIDPPIQDVDKFHDLGEALMIELLKLEECNHDIVDPSVSTEHDRGMVLVELVALGDDLPSSVQKALDVTRTAIHAAGGGTPDWPTAEVLGISHRDVDFRAGAMTSTPVDVPVPA